MPLIKLYLSIYYLCSSVAPRKPSLSIHLLINAASHRHSHWTRMLCHHNQASKLKRLSVLPKILNNVRSILKHFEQYCRRRLTRCTSSRSSSKACLKGQCRPVLPAMHDVPLTLMKPSLCRLHLKVWEPSWSNLANIGASLNVPGKELVDFAAP